MLLLLDDMNAHIASFAPAADVVQFASTSTRMRCLEHTVLARVLDERLAVETLRAAGVCVIALRQKYIALDGDVLPLCLGPNSHKEDAVYRAAVQRHEAVLHAWIAHARRLTTRSHALTVTMWRHVLGGSARAFSSREARAACARCAARVNASSRACARVRTLCREVDALAIDTVFCSALAWLAPAP